VVCTWNACVPVGCPAAVVRPVRVGFILQALREEMDTMRARYEAKIRTLQDALDRAGQSSRIHEDVMALPTPRR
jgi:hypothetical protein